ILNHILYKTGHAGGTHPFQWVKRGIVLHTVGILPSSGVFCL
ncbi:uncharacterized protein METZ01_LOCUS170812, partial [marine metagenome]